MEYLEARVSTKPLRITCSLMLGREVPLPRLLVSFNHLSLNSSFRKKKTKKKNSDVSVPQEQAPKKLIFFTLFLTVETFSNKIILTLPGYETVDSKNAVTGIKETNPQVTVKGVGYVQ